MVHKQGRQYREVYSSMCRCGEEQHHDREKDRVFSCGNGGTLSPVLCGWLPLGSFKPKHVSNWKKHVFLCTVAIGDLYLWRFMSHIASGASIPSGLNHGDMLATLSCVTNYWGGIYHVGKDSKILICIDLGSLGEEMAQGGWIRCHHRYWWSLERVVLDWMCGCV